MTIDFRIWPLSFHGTLAACPQPPVCGARNVLLRHEGHHGHHGPGFFADSAPAPLAYYVTQTSYRVANGRATTEMPAFVQAKALLPKTAG
jgi:hypothetical protein